MVWQEAANEQCTLTLHFLTDSHEKGKVDINYCPTDNMVANYFTKPLQGSKFIKFEKLIMNLDN